MESDPFKNMPEVDDATLNLDTEQNLGNSTATYSGNVLSLEINSNEDAIQRLTVRLFFPLTLTAAIGNVLTIHISLSVQLLIDMYCNFLCRPLLYRHFLYRHFLSSSLVNISIDTALTRPTVSFIRFYPTTLRNFE